MPLCVLLRRRKWLSQYLAKVPKHDEGLAASVAALSLLISPLSQAWHSGDCCSFMPPTVTLPAPSESGSSCLVLERIKGRGRLCNWWWVGFGQKLSMGPEQRAFQDKEQARKHMYLKTFQFEFLHGHNKSQRSFSRMQKKIIIFLIIINSIIFFNLKAQFYPSIFYHFQQINPNISHWPGRARRRRGYCYMHQVHSGTRNPPFSRIRPVCVWDS